MAIDLLTDDLHAAIMARGLTKPAWPTGEQLDTDAVLRDLERRSFRLMDARYPGDCAGTCGRPIERGQRIAYGGRDDVWHPYCAAAVDSKATNGGRSDRGRGRGRGRSGVTTFRTSGGTFYRNARGRCEDAPCCGCCTI